MISTLHIKNIGIIEDIVIDFNEGFNVLTGETGAGKSLIINALNIISGGRFSKEMIRSGEKYSFVEASIYCPENPNSIDGNIIVSREIYLNGRNSCKINGRLATVNELKEFMVDIIDIHGQQDNYNLLVKSINEKVKACLVLTSQVKYNPASIFTIAANKDEFYNYILLEANNNTYTIRLSNINEVILLNDKAEFNKDSLTIFNKQIKYGLQYPVSKKEDNPVVVKLTKKGIKLFNDLYLYRPIPDKIEEDIYTFNAPYAQILQYFKRFGDDALIISPACLTNTMANFYYFANKTYKKLRTKEKIEE